MSLDTKVIFNMLYNQTTHKLTRQLAYQFIAFVALICLQSPDKLLEITNINEFHQRRGVQAACVVGYSECGVIHVLPVLLIFKYEISSLKQI